MSAGLTLEGGRLRGEALFVLDVEGASDYLVADRAGQLHRVSADDPNVEATRLTTIDRTRSYARVTLNGAATETLPGSTDPNVVARTVDAGRVNNCQTHARVGL